MKLSTLFKPTKLKRVLFFVVGDIFISIFTLFLSYLLRFNFAIPGEYLDKFFAVASVLITTKIIFYAVYKLYFVSWRFFSLNELKTLLISTFLAYIVAGFVLLLFRDFFLPFPRSVILIDFFLTILFIGFFRISKRLVYEKLSTDNPPALLIGANTKTISLLKQDIPYSVSAIFDDKSQVIDSYMYGYRVGDIEDIDGFVKTAIITKELQQKELDKLVDFLHERGVEEIKIYNPFEERIKDISIEDLLARKPKDLDKDAIRNFIKDKKVLITGAGGSIGSEICRQCEAFGARELILVENSEYNLYSINEELSVERKCYLSDVRHMEDLAEIFEKELPEIVIHAAAYKHVPMCESNQRSAIENNVVGTKNVIDVAIKYKAEDLILISTDKAVRPTNIMGATKRVCELYAQNVDPKETKISAVRFGNVLGSSGSVVPRFKKLLDQNRPLEVTHPDITRYFMLIPEACQLVLQAGSLAKSGEIFVLDMGEPVRIVDLAKKMLKLYGRDENDIVFTGLRPGEKLYEELLIDETDKKTKYKDIFVASPTKYPFEILKKDIEELLECKNKLEKLKKIVPEFHHRKN